MKNDNIIQFAGAQPLRNVQDHELKRPRNAMPDGRKRIRIDVGTDPETGKRLRKTFTGKTLKECREKRDAWLEAQKDADPSLADKTVAQWAETWRRTYGNSAGFNQNTAVEIDTRRIINALGKLRVSDVK